MKKLGFGLMRLPQTNPEDWSSVDMDKTKAMNDRYMEEGFTYFDTAYVYHGGNSEKAFGELVAKRYPRDSFTITTKMPVFMVKSAEDYERIFDEQLVRCQVDYFDYYFLHAMGRSVYGAVQKQKGVEFMVRKKAEGKIRHIGFSYHDDADMLDRILMEHPETELVQLQLNYIDWENESVQSRKCYEVCVSGTGGGQHQLYEGIPASDGGGEGNHSKNGADHQRQHCHSLYRLPLLHCGMPEKDRHPRIFCTV